MRGRARGDVEPCVRAPWLDMVSETQGPKSALGGWSGPGKRRGRSLRGWGGPSFDILALSKVLPSPAPGRAAAPLTLVDSASILDCIVPSQNHARATGRAARISTSRRPKTRAICGRGGKKMSLARAAAKASSRRRRERREQNIPAPALQVQKAEGEHGERPRGSCWAGWRSASSDWLNSQQRPGFKCGGAGHVSPLRGRRG